MQPSADLSQYNHYIMNIDKSFGILMYINLSLFVLNKSSPTSLNQFFRLDRKRQHNVATEFQCQHYLSNY